MEKVYPFYITGVLNVTLVPATKSFNIEDFTLNSAERIDDAKPVMRTSPENIYCPYCNRVSPVSDTVVRQVQQYKEKQVNFSCKYCGKTISASVEQKLSFFAVKKTDEEPDYVSEVL